MATSVTTLGYVVVVTLLASAAAQTAEAPPPPPPQVEVTPQIQVKPQIEVTPQLKAAPQVQVSPQFQSTPQYRLMQPQIDHPLVQQPHFEPYRPVGPVGQLPSTGGSGGCSPENPCEAPETPHGPHQDLDKCREYYRSRGYDDSVCDGSSNASTPKAEGGVSYTESGTPDAASKQRPAKPSDDGATFLWFVLWLVILFGPGLYRKLRKA